MINLHHSYTMTSTPQTDSTQSPTDNHLPSHQSPRGKTSLKSHQRQLNNNQLYRKITPRRVIDKSAIDQTKYSALLLSSTVYPTGVKVSFLSDGHPLKCGFDVVEHRTRESSCPSVTNQNRHPVTNRILQKIPVVRFLENPRESRTNNTSKTTGNCDVILCRGYNGMNKIVAIENSSRKKDVSGIERGRKDICKHKLLHYNFPQGESAAMVRGLPWEFFSQIARHSRSVQPRTGPRFFSRKHQYHNRCQVVSQRPMPETFAKTGNNRKISGVNCFEGTEILSGVGIFNGQLKELVQRKDTKGVSAPQRYNRICKHRMRPSVGDAFSNLDLPSLEIGTAQAKVQRQGRGKVTPWTLRELLHLPETSNRMINSKQTQLCNEEGRSMKTESGKYRPYSKTKGRDYFITNGIPMSEVKPRISDEPYLNYVGSASNKQTMEPASHESTNFEFKRRLTQNSPVTDDDDLTLLSSWCSSVNINNSKTVLSGVQVDCMNRDLDIVKSSARSVNSSMGLGHSDRQGCSLSTGCSSENDKSQTPPSSTIYVPQGQRSACSSAHSVMTNCD